ncbi:MAG: phosphomannomutase/phosphoglucomutase [Deltaproteobacteria bacterium]|nr:phosphomannomutase/phosphoglucomutase [Deltaproteobacteria bacterium]
MNPHIFREYDIRGLVDKDLTEEVANLLGLGLGTTVRRKGGKTVVLGRDCRESSDRFRDAMIPGLTSTGVNVIDIGVVPTPLTYFAANTLPEVDGLAMITGSHNPKEYNGFKMGAGKTTFHGHEIQALRQLIEKRDFEKGAGFVRQHDIITPYQKFVRETVKVGPRKLKIVIDAGNGVGGAVAVPMFKAMGYEVIDQYCEMDANFPHHHPDPTVVENMHDLIKRVKAEKADVGIAYDGDADRLGVVDDQGNILWGDQLMILFSRELLKQVPGATIVGEVKCSMTMYDDIAKHGGKPIMWKAGHSLIKAKMKETGAEMAGEMSGHIFWTNRYYGFDDGVYSSARLLEILSQAQKPMSQLLDDVPKTFASPEIRFDMPSEEKKFATVKKAIEICRKRGYEMVDVDGVRVIFPDGWGLIRASNTQPILVLRYEAKTEPRLKEIQKLIEGVLDEAQK